MIPLDYPVLGLVLLFRIFVAEPFTVPAGSMMPTLEVGDYFLASKSGYGYSQFSLPFGHYLPQFEILKTTPRRGDVVLFRLPTDPSVVYVKRVIGLAGDRVQVTGGITYLNGKPLPRKRAGDYSDGHDYDHVPVYVETLPDGRSYRIMELTDESDGDNTAEFSVPPGHCFVMGDNRDNSADSRYMVGYLPYANIFAKALVTIDYGGDALKAHAIK